MVHRCHRRKLRWHRRHRIKTNRMIRRFRPVDEQLKYPIMEVIVMNRHLKHRRYQQLVKVRQQLKKRHRQRSIGKWPIHRKRILLFYFIIKDGRLHQRLINSNRRVKHPHHLFHVLFHRVLSRHQHVLLPQPLRIMMIRFEGKLYYLFVIQYLSKSFSYCLDRIQRQRMEILLPQHLLHQKIREQSHLMNMVLHFFNFLFY